MTGSRCLVLALLAFLSCTAASPRLPVRELAPEAELRVPDDLWARVSERAGFPGGAMGRTDAQMRNYPPTAHVPRRLQLAFDDVRYAPRLAGATAGILLSGARSPEALAASAFRLLDVLVQPETKASRISWGAAWTPGASAGKKEAGGEEGDEAEEKPGKKGRAKPPTGPPPALDGVLDRIVAHGRAAPRGPSPEERAAWDRVPEPLKRLAARLFVGAEESAVWIANALPERVLAGDRAALHSMARVPWGDPVSDAFQLPVPRESLALMEEVDLAALGYGSILFMRHVELALAEYRDLSANDPAAVAPLVLETALGRIRIGSAGNDVHPGGDFLVIDPGGDDVYTGMNAASGPGLPVSMVLDLAGNDRYEGGETSGSLAYGLLGIGVLVDAGGNDVYRNASIGIGAACYGFGGLFDLDGDDVYETAGSDSQGAAVMGVGILADLAGNDRYACHKQSQGFALTRGAGILLDAAGNDTYRAAGPKRPDLSFKENPMSLAQGCGFGIRGDYADGHHLAGGFGVFVDGAGDDVYQAGCYSGGAGYWWGMGIFVDLAGDDTSDRSLYSYGAAPHFGVGVCIDAAGNDRYNPANASGRLALGAGRDGGLGWFIDGDGDDRYRVPALCGGASSLNGFGIFWDRRGDDVYQGMPDTKPKEKHGGKPILAFGYAGGQDRKYEKTSDFHDELVGAGVFLDTGGRDAYLQPATGPATHQAADGTEWVHKRERDAAGFGLDLELYAPAGR